MVQNLKPNHKCFTLQKFTCCSNYVIGFYHVLGDLLSFLFTQERNKLYLLQTLFILHVIQTLVGSIRRILLFLIVLNCVQELAVIQKDFLSNEDQTRRGKK